MISKIKFW